MKGYISGKPDIGWWLAQIRLGIAFRKKYARQDRWETWRDMYRGRWLPGILPSNLFFKMLRITVPRVYFRNPAVSVVSKQPGMINWAMAKIVERIDNRLIRDMKTKAAMKTLIQRGFLLGTGIGKLGYGSEYSVSDITASQIRDKEGKFEYNSSIQEGMPWFLPTATSNFVVPSGTRTLEECPWTAEWFMRPVEDVKRDPRFKHASEIGPTNLTSTDLGPSLRIHDRVEEVDLVEIRDKRTGKVIVLSPGSTSRVHIFEDDETQINGDVPYYPLRFNEDDEVFWGIPDSVILEPHQLEINEIRTQQMKHRRISLIKILATQNSMDESEVVKFLSEDGPAVVFTKGNPHTDFKEFTFDIPDALFKMNEQIMLDVREGMGFSRNEFGEMNPPQSRISATEIAAVQEASGIRVDERRDLVADLLVDLVEDMNELIFRNWRETQVVDIIGPMGIPIWVEANPREIGETKYRISVDPDSSVPETREVRAQRAMRLSQIMAGNPFVDPVKLTMHLINEVGGVAGDDLMINFAPGLGTADNPMMPDQFAQFMGLVSQRAGGAVKGGGGEGAV